MVTIIPAGIASIDLNIARWVWAVKLGLNSVDKGLQSLEHSLGTLEAHNHVKTNNRTCPCIYPLII